MRAPSRPFPLGLLLTAGCLTAGCGAADDPLPEPAFAPAAERYAAVARVLEGETLDIEGGQRVRLLGVDAPDGGAVCAAEAREPLARLAEGRRVALDVCEPSPAGQPVSRGEVAAYVVVPGESFVNLEVLRAGLGNPRGVGHCGGPPAQGRLEAARAEAEREGRGIFARGVCRVVRCRPPHRRPPRRRPRRRLARPTARTSRTSPRTRSGPGPTTGRTTTGTRTTGMAAGGARGRGATGSAERARIALDAPLDPPLEYAPQNGILRPARRAPGSSAPGSEIA
jgi:endonuclease YncB( thermonuclease family)